MLLPTRWRSLGSCLAIALGLTFTPSAGLAQLKSPWPKTEEFGGATPVNQKAWIKAADYPGDAVSKGLQGNVIVEFDISVAGRAENCRVQSSSGHKALDDIPCRLIERRAKFRPAIAPDGKPTATQGRFSVAFWMPG